MFLCGLIGWIFVSGCGVSSLADSPRPTVAMEQRTIGLTYRAQGRYPEAIAAFSTSVAFDPTNLAGRVGLGWTQHLAGQAAPATETLVQTAYQDPFHVPTLNALGIVLLTRGYLHDAVMAHSWALGLKPDNEIAYYNLSLAYYRLQKYDWAIAMARRAGQLESSNPHPFVALAIAYEAQGDGNSARRAYRQAVQLDGRYREPDFLNNLSEAGFAVTQIQAAKQVLKQSSSNLSSS
jgi:Flp pilus assembly protein TadD